MPREHLRATMQTASQSSPGGGASQGREPTEVRFDGDQIVALERLAKTGAYSRAAPVRR